MARKRPQDLPVGNGWLSTKEAAILLGVSLCTVWRWIKAGTLKRYRVGERGWNWIALQDVLALRQPLEEPAPVFRPRV